MAQRSSALAGMAGTPLLHQMMVFFQHLCLHWIAVSRAAIAAKRIRVSRRSWKCPLVCGKEMGFIL